MENEFWTQLTRREQEFLLPVLGKAARHTSANELASAALWHLLQYPGNAGTDEEKFLTIRNLMRQLSAIPQAWEQVIEIVGVAVGYLEIRVQDRDEFLAILKQANFAINSWMEKIGRMFGHGHRFDSARAQTRHRHEPQLHLVNDRADEADYGPNYFFVHWDAQSVHTTHGRFLGKIPASLTHRHAMASPLEVDAYLEKRYGQSLRA